MPLSIVTGLLSAFFPPRVERMDDLSPGRRALIRGTVVARDLIESTLTGERCVYYQYTVEEWRNTHMAGLASEGYWALTRFDEAIVEFYLQDERGNRVIVSPEQARVERRRGIEPSAVNMGIFGQRAQELMILPGDVVEVQGMVASAHDLFDAERDYRSGAERFMMCAEDGEQLSIKLAQSGS